MGVQACTTIDVTAWLTTSVALATNPAVNLGAIQDRVDSMTGVLSEAGHRLAADVSTVAMQINMFRSVQRPLPQWAPEQQANPEGTLRQLAIGIFQQVARDGDACRALQASGEFFVEGGVEKVKKFSRRDVGETIHDLYEEANEEYFWGSGPVRDAGDQRWRTESALKEMKSGLEERFNISGLSIIQFDEQHITEILLQRLDQLGMLAD